MIVDGQKAQSSLDQAFDYVIVGSGAAGATVARILADTDSSVAVVEEGPAVDTTEFVDRLFTAQHRLFRGGLGSLLARGRTLIPIIQGSCLGGSTVVNSGIIWRIPEDVWTPWQSVYGLGDALPIEKLHTHWDQIEREIYVQPTPPAVWGQNNQLMDVAQNALSVSGFPTRRNVRDCRGSARCLTGCPFAAKQSMLVSYLPYAEKRGATLFTSAWVQRVILEDDRATGVSGFFKVATLKRKPTRFTLHARRGVIIAASAIQTPGLLRRSGIRSKHLGVHFQGHPGCSLMGVFDRKVNLWFGATQGYEVDQHRKDGRYKIETLSLPPEMVLASMPGVGRKWVENMAEAPHVAIWAVQLRAEARGTVGERLFGLDVEYDLTRRDMDRLRQALKFAAELFFAAGAREVIPNVHGLPERLRIPEEAKLLETGPDHPSAYSFILSHLFGTARMSAHPRDGVVGTDFCVHGTKNLYVTDSSIFPTNLGVNPQHPIMGIAMHAAYQIAERRN